MNKFSLLFQHVFPCSYKRHVDNFNHPSQNPNIHRYPNTNTSSIPNPHAESESICERYPNQSLPASAPSPPWPQLELSPSPSSSSSTRSRRSPSRRRRRCTRLLISIFSRSETYHRCKAGPGIAPKIFHSECWGFV